MGLGPLVLVNVIVWEPVDGLCEDLEPSRIVDVIPVFFLVREEDLKWLIIVHEKGRDAVSSALLIT